MNDDYLSHEEVSIDSQAKGEELSDQIPLDNLYLEDLQLGDTDLEVEDVVGTFELTQDPIPISQPDQNSNTVKDEELEEASPSYIV